jgi:hypothetical protein
LLITPVAPCPEKIILTSMITVPSAVGIDPAGAEHLVEIRLVHWHFFAGILPRECSEHPQRCPSVVRQRPAEVKSGLS